jgi:hypothetical protein
MPYVPFNEHFPEIAENETRTITISDESALGLPHGEYSLIEMYCNERKCDCRRVFFYVVSPPSKKPLAVVAYGWESREFYAKWMRSDDNKMIKNLQGPILNPGSPQSDLASVILEMVDDIILKDKAYIERIKTHYRMFRDKVDKKLSLKRRRNRKIKLRR